MGFMKINVNSTSNKLIFQDLTSILKANSSNTYYDSYFSSPNLFYMVGGVFSANLSISTTYYYNQMVGFISNFASASSLYKLPMGNGQQLGGNTFSDLALSDIKNANYIIAINNFTLNLSDNSSVQGENINPFLLYQPGQTNYTISGSENSFSYILGSGSYSQNLNPYSLSGASCSDTQFYYFATLSNSSLLPSFITISGPIGNQNLTVDAANNSDISNFNIQLTGVLNNDQTYKTYFSINIESSDPCSTATIACNPNVIPQNISMTTTDGQQVYQIVDHTTITPAVCINETTFTLTYQGGGIVTDNAANLTFFSSNQTLLVYFTSAYSNSLYLNGTLANGQSVQCEFSVNVTDGCSNPTFLGNIPSAQPYKVGFGQYNVSFNPWTTDQSACGSLTYTAEFNNTELTMTTQPIGFNPSNQTFFVHTNNLGDVGNYSIKVTATTAVGSYSSSMHFTQEIINPCLSNDYIACGSGPGSQVLNQNTSLVIQIPRCSTSLPVCGQFIYEAFNDTSGDSLNSTIFSFNNSTSQVNNTLAVTTSLSTTPGAYPVYIFCYQLNQPSYKVNISFTVNINTFPCSSNTITKTNGILNQLYITSSSQININVTNLYASLDSGCSLTSATLICTQNCSPDTDFISLDGDNSTLSIYTTDPDHEGNTYHMQLTLTENGYSLVYNFTVTIMSSCQLKSLEVGSSNANLQTFTQMYMVGANALTIFVNFFTQIPECNLVVAYNLSIVGYSSLPPFISVPENNTLAILTSNASFAGNYTIRINGSVQSNNQEFKADLYIPLEIYTQNLGPPYFQPALSNVKVEVGKTQTFSFPNLQDPDGDSTQVYSVNFGSAASYIKGSYPTYTVSPAFQGTFKVQVTVGDNHPVNPMNQTYRFYIVATDAPKNKTQNNTNSSDSSYYVVKTNTSSDLQARITSINTQGLVTVKFNKNVDVPRNYQSFNQSVLQIIVINGGQPVDLNFTWNISLFLPNEMQIQLHFFHPSQVSSAVRFIILSTKDSQFTLNPIRDEWVLCRSTDSASHSLLVLIRQHDSQTAQK